MTEKIERGGLEVGLAVLGEVIPGVSAARRVVNAIWPDANEEWRKAAVADMQDQICEVQARIEDIASELETQGARLDDLGAIRTQQVVETFCESCAHAQSDSKRAALVAGAASQFDPRLGSQAARRYWLDVVASLDDLSIRAIELLGEHVTLHLDMRGDRWTLTAPAHGPDSLVDVSHDELVGLRAKFTALHQSGYAGVGGKGYAGRLVGIELREPGKTLAKFIGSKTDDVA